MKFEYQNRKKTSETEKIPWYKKTWIWLVTMATAIACFCIPLKNSIFAESIVCVPTGWNYQIVGDPLYSGDSFAFYTDSSRTIPVYCIQAYSLLNPYAPAEYSTSSFSSYPGLTTAEIEKIRAITYYGYMYDGRGSIEWYYATQLAIWEITNPGINISFGPVNNNHGQYNATVNNCKNQILADVNGLYQELQLRSSWKITDSRGVTVTASSPNAVLEDGHIGETYTITDTNGYLTNSTIVSNGFGSRLQRNGNSFTITLDASDFETTKTVEVEKNTVLRVISTTIDKVYTNSAAQNLMARATPSITRIIAEEGRRSLFSIHTTGSPVTFTKRNEAGKALEGANLTLYKIVNGVKTPIETYTSTTEPKKFILAPGDYQMVENEAPAGYYKSQPVNFTVQNLQSIQHFEMSDEPFKVKIKKIDNVTGGQIVNANLELKDSFGRVIDTWITDGSEHEIDTSTMVAGEAYTIIENGAVQGYYPLKGFIQFTLSEYKPTTGLDANGYKVIDVTNTQIDYRVDKKDNYTGESIVGAKLQLLDASNKVIDEWVTDGNPHKIENTKIALNKTYKIHEVSAPSGYYIMPEDKIFKVEEGTFGQTVIITAYDVPITYSIQKYQQGTQSPVSGAVLALYDSSNNLIDQWTTNGTEHILSGLKDGETYTIQEISAPAGFYRVSTPKKFTVKQTSQSSQMTPIMVTFEEPVIEFYVIKRDAKGNPMAGATLQLQKEDGTVLTELTSSSLGKVQIPSQYLEAGKKYIVHESGAVDGYYYSTTDAAFTVPATAEEAKALSVEERTVQIIDNKIKFSVLKLDSKTGETVEGAALGLYAADDPTTLISRWVTTDEAFDISEATTLLAGKEYIIRELATPDSYYLNEQGLSFTVPLTSDGKMITLEFTNKPIEWHIRKVDEQGATLSVVNGSSFILEVYDTHETFDTIDDDTLICTLDTADEDYQVKGYFDMKKWIADGLIKGGMTYRIHEAKPANGYTVAPDQNVIIQVDETTDTVVSTVTDEAVEVYLRKVDPNGNVLHSYKTISNDKTGFKIGIYDEDMLNAGASLKDALVVELDTTSSEYAAYNYFDVSSYLHVQKNYVAKEITYPNGYYKAKDVSFTVDSLGTVNYGGKEVKTITLVDPPLMAQFRKEDKTGTLLSTVNGESFKFQVIENSTGIVVGTIDTADSASYTGGWIPFGQWLKEATTYRIHEISAPSGYAYAPDAYITTPGYYVESAGSIQNVVIQSDSPLPDWQNNSTNSN